ncbi:ribosomal L28e/Mak16 [Phlyctochytrium arcticum]|nr:ribosomal L28e/Mak16 [Phlyctochytrium arcticum]
MSGDLIWLLTRDTSSFLVKRNGVRLSREPGNLLNVNSFKYSGLAQRKSIHVASSEKGAALVLKKNRVPATKPSKVAHQIILKKGQRASAKSVQSILRNYRPDLQTAALARVSRVLDIQKPARVQKQKKVRGVRAKKLSA